MSCFFCISLNAQNVEFGLKGGLNLANFIGDNASGVDYKYRIWFNAGMHATYFLTDNFGIGGEVNYSGKGANYEETFDLIITKTNLEIKEKYDYITFPVLAKARFGDKTKFFVSAGPYFGFLIADDVEIKITSGGESIDTNDFKRDINSLDYGAAFSIGLQGKATILEFRYEMGINNIYDIDNSPDIKNGVLSINLGWVY